MSEMLSGFAADTSRSIGLGARVRGGIYLEIDRLPHGHAIESHIVDPSEPVDPSALGITPKGVALAYDGGDTVVIDWIGEQAMSNVADAIECARRFGISRRLPSNIDFEQLGHGTRLWLVHSRAIICNPGSYWTGAPAWCPCRQLAHLRSDYRAAGGMCAALWWHDLTGGTTTSDATSRTVRRTLPGFSYLGQRRPDDADPRYQAGVVLRCRIDRIVVVRDPIGGRHESALARAAVSDLPVTLVDQ